MYNYFTFVIEMSKSLIKQGILEYTKIYLIWKRFFQLYVKPGHYVL